MVWLDSHYLGLEQQDLVELFCGFIFPHTSPIILLICLCQLWCINLAFFIQYNEILPPLHVEFCQNIDRTKCYQLLPLVIFRISSWWWVFSTRAWFSILLTRKSLPPIDNSWCHMSVTISLPSLKLSQNFTVDEWDVDRMQRNKGWSTLIMLQYPGQRLMCSECGASMGIHILRSNFGAAQGHH